MSDTLAVLAASMRADAEALRLIGQNVASTEVPAYRRQIPIQGQQFVDLVGEASAARDALSAQTRDSIAVDTNPGTIKVTGEPLNVAIEGAGFLVLETARGQVFTRRGDLRISADGTLVAATGDSVLGSNGPVQVGSEIPTIEADGTVRVGKDAIDQLQLVHFADVTKLQYLGNGLYANPNGVATVGDAASTVRQGALESSNVSSVNEMVQMMETLRHFESTQKLIRGYDDMMGKAISELGKVG